MRRQRDAVLAALPLARMLLDKWLQSSNVKHACLHLDAVPLSDALGAAARHGFFDNRAENGLLNAAAHSLTGEKLCAESLKHCPHRL